MGVELINLTKSFDGKVKISGLTYRFPDRGVVAVLGDSGVGKTTLARMIAGLDTDYRGEIVGGGIGNVAYAFQEYRLFPTLSAIDNLVYANHDKATPEAVEKAKNILLRLGFEEFELSLKPSALSGGMKQRVSLARAFLNDAPILILDEATKELDTRLKQTVLELIAEQAKKRLVILITHDEDEIERLGAQTLRLEAVVTDDL